MDEEQVDIEPDTVPDNPGPEIASELVNAAHPVDVPLTAELVEAAEVWALRATHSFEDWAMHEVRQAVANARTRGLVKAGFLEVLDDGTS
jgi:hypothetical protein